MIKQKYLRKLSNFSENDLKENQNSNQIFFDDMNRDYRKMDTLMDLMRFSEKIDNEEECKNQKIEEEEK